VYHCSSLRMNFPVVEVQRVECQVSMSVEAVAATSFHSTSTHFQCDSTHRRFTSQHDTTLGHTFSLFIILTFYNVQKIIVQAINVTCYLLQYMNYSSRVCLLLVLSKQSHNRLAMQMNMKLRCQELIVNLYRTRQNGIKKANSRTAE